jgi:arginase
MEREITFIVNRSEIAAGTRGASMGPDAIFTAARSTNNPFFSRFNIAFLPDKNQMLDVPTSHQFAKRIDGLLEVFDSVSTAVDSSLNLGQFPIVLAGDHGSAGGTIAGIKKHFPEKRIGVIWIDAHGDLHTPYTTPSGNMHGMPLAVSLGEDNLPCAKNNVPKETIELWEKLKNCGHEGAKILAEDLVFIGVRDTETEEDELMNRLKIKRFSVEEVQAKGADTIAGLVLDYLEKCDILYVSFDVDSMDPIATSFGTGTPVKNGLMPKQAKQLLKLFGESSKTVCMEFVEVNPCLDDKRNRMGEVAFEILENVVEHILD